MKKKKSKKRLRNWRWRLSKLVKRRKEGKESEKVIGTRLILLFYYQKYSDSKSIIENN